MLNALAAAIAEGQRVVGAKGCLGPLLALNAGLPGMASLHADCAR